MGISVKTKCIVIALKERKIPAKKADKRTGHETAYVKFEKFEHEKENEFAFRNRKSELSEFRKP
jgi:ribosomal protein L20